MQWEDERYVRLYTRDTLTWTRLGWHGQAVFSLLIRKVDRAGVIEIEDEEPAVALSGITGIPVEVCDVAWLRLSSGKRPTVTLRDGSSRALIVPNFVEAQEARQSDKARARKARELRRMVTPRDEPSHRVTEDNDRSHGVTPSCAVPSRTQERNTEGVGPEKAPAPPLTEPLQLLPQEPPTPLLAYLAVEFAQAKAEPENEKAWAVAFPGVDLLAEAKNARRWELDNPTLVKTQKRRFLGNWFAKAQNDAARRAGVFRNGHGQAKPSGIPAAPPDQFQKAKEAQAARLAGEKKS